MKLRHEAYHPQHPESEQSYRDRRIDERREKRQEPQLDEQVVARVQADLDREREERRLAEEQAGWSPREIAEPDELLDAESAPQYAGMAHLNTYTEKARAWFTGKRAHGKRVDRSERNIDQDAIRDKPYKTAQEIERETNTLKLQEMELAFCEKFNAENIRMAVVKNIDAALVFIIEQDSFRGVKNFDELVDLAENTIIETVRRDANYAQVLIANYNHPNLPIKMKRLSEALRIADETLERTLDRRRAA